jgi:hypothetical protein
MPEVAAAQDQQVHLMFQMAKAAMEHYGHILVILMQVAVADQLFSQ